uniref:Uncharacterized protein n=1 Tax=Timema monikensis TaxID=170555 RepID=A0A7R9DYA2_9NEOP|nr:unnamed protein product [Timema monikensis]
MRRFPKAFLCLKPLVTGFLRARVPTWERDTISENHPQYSGPGSTHDLSLIKQSSLLQEYRLRLCGQRNCYSYEAADACDASNGTYYHRECYNWTDSILYNVTRLAQHAERRPPAEEYFKQGKTTAGLWVLVFLCLSKGVQSSGKVRPQQEFGWCAVVRQGKTTAGLWVIVLLWLSKGVQSSGKVRPQQNQLTLRQPSRTPDQDSNLDLSVIGSLDCCFKSSALDHAATEVVYFTALFPYVVLVILFVRGVTLPGASNGILFYLTPDWKQLFKAQVWGDAAVQIFFALSPAWGGLITLSSYNKFSNNCYRDSLIVAVSNILTSFFAGLVIFSVIGFLAHELGVQVDHVVDQGAGLAFIVYPEVVTRLPCSPLWSLLFFVMLLTLGLDSQFALMETVTTAILDKAPNLRDHKLWVVLGVAIFGYFGGLIFTTNVISGSLLILKLKGVESYYLIGSFLSGMYWLQLMDKYAANWSVLLIAISECVLISWVYGANRFLQDIQDMIGPQSRAWRFFWCWMWRIVTPSALLFILFFNWVEYTPVKYGDYVYPIWADAIGWVFGVFPVTIIISVACYKMCTKAEGTIIQSASPHDTKPECFPPRHQARVLPPMTPSQSASLHDTKPERFPP